MTKTIGIIIFVAVLGVGAYFAFQPKETVAPTDETNTEVSTVETPVGKKMAFSEFIKQGGSYECTVNQEANNTTVQGKVYLSGENLRGEFATNYNGTSMNVTTIVREGYAYTWSSMMASMGFKSKVTAPSEVNTDTAMSGSYSWNAETIGDYDCKPWSADNSKFTLPTGVTFTEVGQ